MKTNVVSRPRDTLTNAYAQHWSAMSLEVDKLGRRTKRTLNTGPTQRYVYEDSLGVLLRTIDSQSSSGGDTVRFTWDAAGRLLSKRVGALPSETFTYDTLGNLTESNAANRFFNDYEYDARGKQTLRRTISALGIEYEDTTRTSYDGFGAVIAREQFRPYGGWNTFADEYHMDGLGNILAHDSNRGWSSHRRRAEYIYAWERLTSQYNEPLSSERQPNGQPAVTSLDNNTYEYDAAGNTITQSTTMKSVAFNGSYDVETPTFAGASRARHYYDATNRLRHVERWFGQDSGKHTIQEYRYDALGRRVLLRTRKDSLSNCANAAPQTAAKCLQTIDRFFWDGDQLLLERRRAGRWNLPLASLDSVAGGTGAFFGEVRYVHAIGIDDPLIVRKSGHAAFAPLRSGRGGYETGLYLNGTLMTAYHWPGKQEGVYPGLDGRYPETADLGWFGSLLDNKRDASGMIYMRNRYYDPGSGRFTQRDPIGLAGGVNQYGYAGGDPVNFSDPFGLHPACIPMPTVCAAGAKLAWHGVLLTVALVATAAQEWRANARTDEAVGKLEGDGEVSETSTGTRIVDRTGEGSSAEESLGEMADQLGREVQTSKDGKTQYIRLPGGGTASSRPTSSGGDPTVQVNRPGHRPTKVRFDNP